MQGEIKVQVRGGQTVRDKRHWIDCILGVHKNLEILSEGIG